jgi:hypothetical protein
LEAEAASFFRGFGEENRVLQQLVFVQAPRAPQSKENAADTGQVGKTGCSTLHQFNFGTATAAAQSRFRSEKPGAREFNRHGTALAPEELRRLAPAVLVNLEAAGQNRVSFSPIGRAVSQSGLLHCIAVS